MKKLILTFVFVSSIATFALGAETTVNRKIADNLDVAAIQAHFKSTGSYAFCDEWHEIEPTLRAVFTGGLQYTVTQLVIAPANTTGSQKACVAVSKK
jgi:hypothetical protein